MAFVTPARRDELGFVGWCASLLVLLLPTALLGALAARTDLRAVAVGAGVQALFALVLIRTHPVWKPPVSASLVVLYLIALAWLWMPTRGSADWAADWAVQAGQGALLLFAVLLAAVHDLTRTGAEPLRRANKWCARLAGRAHWPLAVADCRNLPEVAALRSVAADEVRPVLALLSDPRPEVQCVALCALEYRPVWFAGEAELVLKAARASHEPAVRAAAAYALATSENAEVLVGLAALLRDPMPEVRAAASDALLWNAAGNWPFVRDAVRAALAEPLLADDGPLFSTGRLPAPAIADLITWSEHHAPLAPRAIQTLVEQYHRDLTDGEQPGLAHRLAAAVLDANAPPALRVELAVLLRDHNLLSANLLDRLTSPHQPAPIRLFAAELMLQQNPHDPDGVDVLRGLARTPNREMALSVAAVLQNVLGLDLGLPPGEMPLATSKVAAEVARRVLLWANGAPADTVRPTPGPTAGLRGTGRPSIPGLAPASRPGTLSASAIPPTPPPLGEPDELPPDVTPRPRNGSRAVF
jgi:hypothetical protein